jgi:hypothetical protein
MPDIMIWIPKHPRATPEMLGFIPSFLSPENPAPAREQIDAAYSHGGGWRAFEGFRMAENGNLLYADDAPVQLLYETRLRGETIRFYDYALVAIVQKDGSFEVTRID